MTPQTAQWYLEIVKAYLEDPQKAQDKYQLSPSLLKDVFKNALGTDDLNRVEEILEGILGGKALGQNVPDPDLLQYWEEEYERVRLQKIKITDDVIREIRKNIKYRQMMAQQIHKIMDAERNKPEISEIEEKPEYVQQSFEDLSFELNERIPSAVHEWARAKIKPTKEDYTDTILSFALEISKRRELLGLSKERLASIAENLAEETYQTASEFIETAPLEKVREVSEEKVVSEGSVSEEKKESVLFSAKSESEPVQAQKEGLVEIGQESKRESVTPSEEFRKKINLPFGLSFGKKIETESAPVQKATSATAVAEKPEVLEKFTILPQSAPPHMQTPLESTDQGPSGQKKETPKKKLSAIEDLRRRIGYEEGEGVIFVPILSFISPTMTWALLGKSALAPVVKPLQAIDILAGENLEGEGVSEWREMLHHGKTSADLDATLSAMQEEGKINYDDPVLADLEKERARTEAYEQAHPKIHWLLKNYHRYSKLTGNQKVTSEALGGTLPKLSPRTWVKSLDKDSSVLKIKRGFDKVGEKMFFAYDKKTGEFGLKKLSFVPQDKLVRIMSFGKIQSWSVVKSWLTQHWVHPIFARLGKTAFGQSLKKFGAGLLAKLGVKMGIRGAAAAAAPETLGLSLLIGFALELLGKIFDKLKPLIKKFSTFLIGAGLGLAGLAIGLPLGIPLLAASAFLIGMSFLGPSFALGVVGGVGGAIGTAASTATGLLVAITAPITGTVSAVLIAGSLAALAGTTFFIVTLTAGAFSGFPPLPRVPGEGGEVPPPASEFIDLEKHVLIGGTQTDPARVDNKVVDQKEPAKYTIKLTVKDKTLTNIVVTDDTTVSNKDGSFSITKDSGGNNIGPWNSTTDPALAKMDPGQTWEKTYTIILDDERYKDSTITNLVKVTSAEGETAFANRSFIIGASMAGSCPLKGGGPITCGSYINPNQGCHGTNSYWDGNPPACSYPIGGFLGPNDSNSKCYTACKNANNCGPGYGFAVDVGGSPGQQVVFPSVNGENITWTSSWAGPCGADGCGTNYRGSDSKGNTYWLYVTHMESQGVAIGPPKQSGDVIGYLKDLSKRGGTHLHYELAINGATVRPEFLCQ